MSGRSRASNLTSLDAMGKLGAQHSVRGRTLDSQVTLQRQELSGLKTRILSLIGLAILFLVSLAGVAGQVSGIVADGEDPSLLALWLGGLVATGAAIGFLAARARREASGFEEATAPAAVMRDLLEKVPVGIAVFDADGQLQVCNSLWRTLLVGSGELATLGNLHAAGAIPSAGAASPDGQASDSALERQLDSGIWVRFQQASLGAGTVLVSVQDITREHVTVSRARSERERSRLLLSAAGAWIWETDVLHRFSLAVSVRSEVTQGELDWLIGRSLTELAMPANNGGDLDLSKCIEGMQGHRRLTDVRLTLFDGARMRAIRLSGVPRIDDDGVFLGYCGVGFFDTLPADAEPAPQSETMKRPVDSAAGSRGQRVLLVDDSQTNRLLGVSILKKMGYQCDAVENGQEAVEAVREGSYGLVLMDIRMPAMDGFEATSQIRGLPGPVAAIPVVAMTAHVEPEDRQLCLASGMDDHVSKPVDRQVLSSVLHRLIGPPEDANAAPGDEAAKTSGSGPGEATLADGTTLEQLRIDAGPELVSELVVSFMKETDQRLVRMRDAMRSGELETIAAEAHAMKSSSGTFGALRLQRAVERIEAAAEAADADLAAELLDRLPGLVADSWREFARAGYPPPE